MANILKSKKTAWCALLLIILIIALTFRSRMAWWSFFDVFFAFMMIFCQLVAVYLTKYSPVASRKLQICAAVFGVLMILALIGEFIAYQFVAG